MVMIFIICLKIQEWYEELDERQIAVDKLGIAVSTWEKYKKENPELREVLKRGKQHLVGELKTSLKKKAKGFYYEETKTCIRELDGKQVKTIEKTNKLESKDYDLYFAWNDLFIWSK